jgi:hypothetical protein
MFFITSFISNVLRLGCFILQAWQWQIGLLCFLVHSPHGNFIYYTSIFCPFVLITMSPGSGSIYLVASTQRSSERHTWLLFFVPFHEDVVNFIFEFKNWQWIWGWMMDCAIVILSGMIGHDTWVVVRIVVTFHSLSLFLILLPLLSLWTQKIKMLFSQCTL